MNPYHYAAMLNYALEWVQAEGFDPPADDWLTEAWELLAPQVREAVARDEFDDRVRVLVGLGNVPWVDDR